MITKLIVAMYRFNVCNGMMDAILLTVALDKLRINAQLFLSPGHLAMIMEGAYTRAKRGRKGRRAAHNIMCDVYVSVLLMAKQVWENS